MLQECSIDIESIQNKKWYLRDIKEIMLELGTSNNGLSSIEVI